MKISLTNQILFCVLALCLAGAMLFCVQTVNSERDFRNYKSRGDHINTWIPNVRALAADCVEYSKRNPAIVPILEQTGLLGNKSTAPAAKPAANK
jgi:hypothetical protein